MQPPRKMDFFKGIELPTFLYVSILQNKRLDLSVFNKHIHTTKKTIFPKSRSYLVYVMTSLALLEWLLIFSMYLVIISKVTFQNIDTSSLPIRMSLENKPVPAPDDKTLFVLCACIKFYFK